MAVSIEDYEAEELIDVLNECIYRIEQRNEDMAEEIASLRDMIKDRLSE